MLSVEQLVAFAQSQPASVVLPMVVTALLGVYTLFGTLTRSNQKQKKRFGSYVYPQPASTLPFLGNTLDMAFYHRDRLYDWIADECLALKGPWSRPILGRAPMLVLSTPELFEDVMKTQFEVFPKGEGETDFYSDLFGKGILASDGDVWYFHRKTASNLFSNQMIRDVMYEAVREKVQTLCEVLRLYEAQSKPVSFRNVISQYTSDVFGKIGFGVDLNCLQNGVTGDKGNEFVDAFVTATRIIFLRFIQPRWLWHLKRNLNVGSEKTLRETLEVINSFIFRIINESVARKNASSTSDNNEPTAPAKDLISLFLNSKVKEDANVKGKAFDSEMHLIRDTVVNFIFAGKDTTSHSMSWFIISMNRYPQVLKKIRAELNEKLPGLVSGETPIPSIDDLPQLTYLEAAIRENMRLNPVLPMSAREANQDTVLCDGTPVPKGTRVTLALYAASRRTEIWGDDALEFKPERWIDQATGKLAVFPASKNIYFWAGPRQCIGMKFAMMQLKCTMAVLLSKFDLKTAQDPWTITYQAALTMTVKGDLMVKVSSLADGGAALISGAARSA
ncbi:Cytochrome p450 [Globisporangium polare]